MLLCTGLMWLRIKASVNINLNGNEFHVINNEGNSLTNSVTINISRTVVLHEIIAWATSKSAQL